MGAAGLGALGGAPVARPPGAAWRGLGRWVGRPPRRSFRRGADRVLALSRAFWLSALLLIPVGAAMMVEMASSNTLIQAMVPNELRGPP